MPKRDNLNSSKKYIKKQVLEEINFKYGDINTIKLQKVIETNTSVVLDFGLEKRNLDLLDGGKVHFSMPIKSPKELKFYVNLGLYKREPYTGKQLFTAIMKTYKSDSKWHSKIKSIADMSKLFTELEIGSRNEFLGIRDPLYTSTGISKRWLNRVDRSAISEMKYKILFLSGGRIDFLTDKMRANGGGCYHGFITKSGKSTLEPKLKLDYIQQCFTEIYLVYILPKNCKGRKFDTATFKFDNEK